MATGVLSLTLFGWFTFEMFNLDLVRTSAPITYRAYQEPARENLRKPKQTPRSIIVFVADGLGFSHLSLGLHTQRTDEVPVWQRFSTTGWYDTRPLAGPITDSAASGTALGTGFPTTNDRIGLDKDGTVLSNLFEEAWLADYRTGIVTDSYIWDATPAAFVTHTINRDNAEDIMRQLAQSQLEILFGELEDVGEGDVPDWNSSMEILASRFHMLDAHLKIPPELAPDAPLATAFPEDSIMDDQSTPSLLSMTEVALTRLSSTDQRFLLLVESEEMDSASHKNDSKRLQSGLYSIQNTLEFLLNYVEEDGDTLLLVISDHETGGLAVSYDLDTYPNLKLVWASNDHTATVVPWMAMGPGADVFLGVKRIWELGLRLKGLLNKGTSGESR